jgi:hypothetical protein
MNSEFYKCDESYSEKSAVNCGNNVVKMWTLNLSCNLALLALQCCTKVIVRLCDSDQRSIAQHLHACMARRGLRSHRAWNKRKDGGCNSITVDHDRSPLTCTRDAMIHDRGLTDQHYAHVLYKDLVQACNCLISSKRSRRRRKKKKGREKKSSTTKLDSRAWPISGQLLDQLDCGIGSWSMQW